MLPERTAQIAGFRYFNVYGPREGHKGRMASVVWHLFNQYRANGKVQLFEGSGGYAAGEQRRDFVSVEDVIKVNLDFLDHSERSGIWNLGTGRATTFNAVAAATIVCDGGDSASVTVRHQPVPVTVAGCAAPPSTATVTDAPVLLTVPHSGNGGRTMPRTLRDSRPPRGGKVTKA